MSGVTSLQTLTGDLNLFGTTANVTIGTAGSPGSNVTIGVNTTGVAKIATNPATNNITGNATFKSGNSNLTISADAFNVLTFTATGTGGGGNWSYKGIFSETSGTVYEVNDVVFDTINTHETYICIVGYTTGALVTPPSADATNWLLFATNSSTGGGALTATSLILTGNASAPPITDGGEPGLYLQKDPESGLVTALGFGSGKSPAEIALTWSGDSENPYLQMSSSATIGSNVSTTGTAPVLSFSDAWVATSNFSSGSVAISPINSNAYVANKFIVGASSNADPSTNSSDWVSLGVGSTGGGTTVPVLWDNTSAYAIGAVVNVGDLNNPSGTFICITTVSAPVSPAVNPAPADTSADWTPVAPLQSVSGSGNMLYNSTDFTWVDSNVYALGEIAQSSNVVYVSKSNANTSNIPASNVSFWQPIGSTVPGGGIQSIYATGNTPTSGNSIEFVAGLGIVMSNTSNTITIAGSTTGSGMYAVESGTSVNKTFEFQTSNVYASVQGVASYNGGLYASKASPATGITPYGDPTSTAFWAGLAPSIGIDSLAGSNLSNVTPKPASASNAYCYVLQPVADTNSNAPITIKDLSGGIIAFESGAGSFITSKGADPVAPLSNAWDFTQNSNSNISITTATSNVGKINFDLGPNINVSGINIGVTAGGGSNLPGLLTIPCADGASYISFPANAGEPPTNGASNGFLSFNTDGAQDSATYLGANNVAGYSNQVEMLCVQAGGASNSNTDLFTDFGVGSLYVLGNSATQVAPATGSTLPRISSAITASNATMTVSAGTFDVTSNVTRLNLQSDLLNWNGTPLLQNLMATVPGSNTRVSYATGTSTITLDATTPLCITIRDSGAQ